MHINVGLTHGSQKQDIKNALELNHDVEIDGKRILIKNFFNSSINKVLFKN